MENNPAINNIKENSKGSSRGYHHQQRRLLLALLAVVAILALLPTSTHTSDVHSRDENVGVLSDQAIHPTEYGVQGTAPLVMIRSSLDDNLLERFLEEHLFSCSQDDLDSIAELDNRVKPPVYVYEGYCHGLPTKERVYSKNPNPLKGFDFDKPPASPFTRAFYTAFRHVNRNVFQGLQEALLLASSSHNKNATDDDVCSLLARWIEQDKHFADLSVQIHYGQGNEAKLRSGAAWHADAENSLLHLAVTLRGKRTLHSKRTTQRGGRLAEILEEQWPGSTYLSSSTLVRHAPSFSDTDFASRSIAIHARILYTNAELKRFRSVRTPEAWKRLTGVLANTLARADLKIPTLEQVNHQLSQIG